MFRSNLRARGALAGLATILSLAAAASASIRPADNPADHPRLVSKPIEGFRYDAGERCRSDVPRGMRAFSRWLDRNVRGESWGITRCEKWGPGSFSLHAEGRAIDWRLDASSRKDKRAAMRLIRTLLARDRKGNDAALARRMGVQGLIFNCRAWWSGMDGLDDYSYCFKANGERRDGLNRTQAHRDHIHLELNKPGARKRTSFWRSPLADR